MNTAPSTWLVPAENAVRAQFANPPALETVARQLLKEAIEHVYPSLNIDLLITRLAVPLPQGGWGLEPLMPKVLDYLGGGPELNFDPIRGQSYYLCDSAPTWLTVEEGNLDMNVINQLIKELAWRLPIGLQDALTAFWGEDSGAGGNRWNWLSGVIKDTLTISAFIQADLNADALAAISQIITTPELDKRIQQYGERAIRAYWMKVSLVSEGKMSSSLSQRIILATPDQVLMCRPNGTIRSFKSIDDLSRYWGANISKKFAAQNIRLKRFELEGNAFEAIAAAILNHQLESISLMRLPASIGWQALETVYMNITDTAKLLIGSPYANSDTLERVKTQMPEWLTKASLADQTTYRHYSLALSAIKKVNKGQTYLSGISSIQAYAVDVLHQQLLADWARFEPDHSVPVTESLLEPENIELTFLTVTGALNSVGIVEPVTMSLTELALRNLVGRPKGRLTLRHKLGLELPAWLTPDYVTRRDGLIEQVNIGKAYPERLEDLLLKQTPAIKQREQLFAELISLQLPLEALELSLRRVNGVTTTGARYVAALVKLEAGDRFVDGADIVIRRLALVRKPGAVPDVVANMFIIEPANLEQGPHLLYRPFYAQSLLEFPTRTALLDALVEAGDLQDSVLTWLSDVARPIYDHGGFKEPHFVRFGLGSDFAPIEIPQPAFLATNGTSNELLQYLQNGQLMQFLFGCTARAMVDQAEDESTSNSESRWRVFIEGGSLILNSLLVLPIQPRPLMLTSGLFGMAKLAFHAIPELASEDKATRELAAADVLINLGMVLLHPLLSALPQLKRLPEGLKSQALRPFAPTRLAEQWPEPPAPEIDSGAVALTGEYPNSETTVLDFSFTNARNQLTPSQRKKLAEFEVVRPASLPPAQSVGRRRGLFRIDDTWHALIDGYLYAVDVDPSGAAVIVSSSDFNQRGPAVKSDGQGQWKLDLRLRNSGGMPPRRIAAHLKKTEERILELNADLDSFIPKELPLAKTVEITQTTLQRAESDGRFPQEQLAELRNRLNTALYTQMSAYQKLLGTAQERITLKIPFSEVIMTSLLEKAFDNRADALALSASEQRAILKKWPQFLNPGPDLETASDADPEGFLQFMKEQAALNEKSIERLEQRNTYLDQLQNLGSAGAKAAEPLFQSISNDAHTVLSLKAFQLDCLKLLSSKLSAPKSVEESLDNATDPLKEHIQTHNELNRLEVEPVKRLEILDSLVESYGLGLDALQGINVLNADELEPHFFNKLNELLKELYQDATRLLAAELKPVGTPRKKPQSRPPSAGKPHKKVINVRGKGKLIGGVKPAGKDWPIEVVEVRSDYADQLISTYSQHGDEWVEIQEPVKPVISPTRAFNVIKGEARKVLGMYQEHLNKAHYYKTLCRHPEEIEELLNHQATRLDKLVNELAVALQAVPLEARILGDQTLLDSMRRAAQTLLNEGQALRIQLSLELPPTHGNLQYLLDKEKVQIASLGKRIKLQGERQDFIQEYAINDREGYPLWYAHFHYAKANTPRQEYTVAHLKTKEQRTLSYYSQLAAATNGQAIVNIHRGKIGKTLAERWFLPLAGDK